MKYIKGKDRKQTAIFPLSMEEAIDNDHEVRIINLFVDSLNIEDMGFSIDHIENGRPAYHPKDLLKLYIYGYSNRIRSSRELEKETKRNIEVMWLIKGLSPDHNTISNFRRDNPKAIKKVFRVTVEIAKNFDLIGGKLIAGDSTKLRAQNSKKNNFNPKKIARHIEYIDGKLTEYEAQLSDNDDYNRKEIEKEIDKHKKRKQDYKKLSQELEESGETQISSSDPESRQMITRNNITEVAYNVQTTVDAENNIPIDYKVTNENDSKAMGKMLSRAKTILGSNNFTALYDKGYHTGSEFKTAADLGIDVMVAIPTVASNAPNTAYNVENFKYNADADFYVCPQGNELHTTGTWHKAKTYKFKRYTTRDCMSCPVKSECTKAKYGKGIQRSEYQEYINNNKERIEQNKDYYRKRQAIVEHPYGTIKRQWGFNYIMTKKTIKRAEADVGFIFVAYNLRRLLNIIGIEALRSYLLALFIKISLLLRQFQAFWGIQKFYGLKVFQNLTAPILTKNTNFTKQFCSKTNFVGSF
ncbi:MAG: IS1182 family transposase [Bacteroidales bacterium]|jgi:transposase|nr:IS1182 family transposase [Bacteroidales bacterium]